MIPKKMPEKFKEAQFKPGQSGNPGGRPKRRPISDAYEAVADMPLPDDLRRKLKMPKGATFREAVAIRQFFQAIKGASPAAREIREAIEGKATQRVELTGAGGKPLNPADPAARPMKTFTPEQLDAVMRVAARMEKEAADAPPAGG